MKTIVLVAVLGVVAVAGEQKRPDRIGKASFGFNIDGTQRVIDYLTKHRAELEKESRDRSTNPKRRKELDQITEMLHQHTLWMTLEVDRAGRNWKEGDPVNSK